MGAPVTLECTGCGNRIEAFEGQTVEHARCPGKGAGSKKKNPIYKEVKPQ